MAIEAGGLVVRVVDFSRPLVRLDFPPELLATAAPSRVKLVATPIRGGLLKPSQPARPAAEVEATLTGPAPQADAASQFAGFWYEVKLPARAGNAFSRPALHAHAQLRSA